VLAPLVPIASTPSLAWGVGGRLGAVTYPPAWTATADRLAAAPDGSVLVLPLTAYLDPGFTGGRVVANPAPAWFGARVVTGDDPGIAGLGPSAETDALTAALRADGSAARLLELGIEWAVSLRPDAEPALVDAGFTLVQRDAFLSLWRNPAARPAAGAAPDRP
jgi:hypothetical protein